MAIDRLVLNEALVKLTDGWDEDAAKLVVEFGNLLPKMNSITYESVEVRQDKGTVVGYTREQGNVAIQTSRPEEVKEISWGIKKERIGWFKLWKVEEGALSFHHFWASDITTESENPEDRPLVYTLEYDPETLFPYSLYFWAKKDILRWGTFAICCEYVVPMYGKQKLSSGNFYGISIGPY